MNVPRREITRAIDWIAGIAVVILVVAIPSGYFTIAWKSQDAALRTEVEIFAHEVSNLVNNNPDMWEYEVVRLEGLLSDQPGMGHQESRRVFDREGRIVAERMENVSTPVMRRSHPVMDAGVPVGHLEIGRSIRPMIINTLVLAFTGAALGAALFFLLRIYPMSALRNTLDMLSREKGRAKITLDTIEEGVITVDPEDRIVLVNRAAGDMTGWPQAEASGRPIGEVFCRDGDVLAGRDGSRRLVEAGTSQILDDRGKPIGAVLVFRDVTEKALIEAELLKSQKLESLGILAAGIAHEIRNPLSGINISISSVEHVCAQSSEMEPDIKEKMRIITEQMKSAATKIGAVVQRVMDFSRPTPPRMEIINLNDPIAEAIRMTSSTLRKKEIEVHKDLAPDLPKCRADSGLIEQVLVNLITNAYQAMERMEGPKHLEIASAVQDGRVVIRVSDSGPGVPSPLAAKIFDPFFTTRKEGSGIGLSFSYRIIADHGGTLRVDASKWGGAEFRIELPGTAEGSPA
ncbi:MAG TPA: ATP-binding protein [Candidatus Deferrimicrobiaceae bacterium]|jgi:signal transduction histidine kinase